MAIPTDPEGRLKLRLLLGGMCVAGLVMGAAALRSGVATARASDGHTAEADGPAAKVYGWVMAATGVCCGFGAVFLDAGFMNRPLGGGPPDASAPPPPET